MRTITLLSLVGLWLASTAASTAQVPSSQPLTPPSENVADQGSKGSSTSTPPTGSGPSAQGTSNDSGGSPAPASSSSTAASESATKTAPLTAATLTSMEALDDKNPLEAGDTISFRVIEDRDDAVTRVVTDTGEVDFPYVGRLQVEGKTCHEVAVELKKLLEVDYYKQATVIVGLDLILGQEKTKHDFAWIIGEVRQEGPQELSKLQPMTVSQLILKAGGFTDYADKRKVRIIHHSSLSPAPTDGVPPDISKSKDAEIINVKAVFDGTSSVDPVVKPDDYIIVSRTIF